MDKQEGTKIVTLCKGNVTKLLSKYDDGELGANCIPCGCSAEFLSGMWGTPGEIATRAKKSAAQNVLGSNGTRAVFAITYVTDDDKMKKAGFHKLCEFQTVHGDYMLGMYVRKDEGRLRVPKEFNHEVGEEKVKIVEKVVEKIVEKPVIKYVKVAAKRVGVSRLKRKKLS